MAVKPKTNPTLGRRVKALRRARNLTQGQVEEYSHGRVARSWLSLIETGRIEKPSFRKLAALAEFLGTTPADLIGQTPSADGSDWELVLVAEARSVPEHLRPAFVEGVRGLARGLRGPDPPEDEPAPAGGRGRRADRASG